MSIWRKIILFVIGLILFLLAWNFIFGGISNIYEFVFAVGLFIGLIFTAYVVIKAIQIVAQKGYYSPMEDYFTKITNLAIDLCPPNIRNLYFQGDKDKQRIKAGKIIGLLGIPYLVGEYELDKDGKVQIVENKELGLKVPKFKKISWGKDGDTLIIWERGFIFPKRHFLRCNRNLHSELAGDLTVYDLNPVPYGEFEFPYKQMQKDPARIMIQSQMEVILATHQHQHNLISISADSAIYWNPYMRWVQKQQAELGSTRE